MLFRSDFVCVLGPSGAGKSTLVRAILGEREITNGRLLVGGHDVFGEADALRGAERVVQFGEHDRHGATLTQPALIRPA